MSLFARLFARLRPYWWGSLIAVLLVVVLSFFRLGPAWFVKLIVDDAIPAGDLRLVAFYVAGLLGAALATSVLSAVQLYLEQWVGQKVVFDLRGELYDHLQSQSMSFYDANQTGQLMSRVTNDVNQVQAFLTQGLTRLVNTVVTIAVNLTVMLLLDPALTLVAMSVTPMVIFFQLRMATAQELYRQVARQTAELNVVIQENLSAVKLVKAFDREAHETERFNSVNWAIRQGRMRTTMNRNVAGTGQELATTISAIIIIVFGGWRVMAGDLTVGSLAAFYAYVLAMWSPIRWMTFVNQMSQQATAAGERVFEILDTPLDVAQKPGAVTLPRLDGRLDLDGVWFAYGPHPPLLRDVSVAVPPGQTLALVGPSGSGKTTLINLIPRFYDVSRGAVRVDGHDVRNVALESLRSQIGMVMQETFLFNRTVAENIRYGRPEAPPGAVEAAARAANAHDFIVEFPDGYDTVVGERGMRLSGGQRQRLAIARAILVDPRLLILDEATSSVDTRTDYLIRQALDALMQGRTTIVIAHRLATVQRAHQILVMEKGQITARGTHQELLRSSPLYQHLNEIQFRLERAPAGAGPAETAAGEGAAPAPAGARP